MRQLRSIVCIVIGAVFNARAEWQRMLFTNQAHESVLITIDDEGVTPRTYHIVQPLARVYLFPRMPRNDRVLYIRLSSASLRQEVTLGLRNGIAGSMMLAHGCSSYGDLFLARAGLEVAHVPAPPPDGTIALVYTEELDLEFDQRMKSRMSRRFSCRPRCNNKSVCRKRSCYRRFQYHEQHIRPCTRPRCLRASLNV